MDLGGIVVLLVLMCLVFLFYDWMQKNDPEFGHIWRGELTEDAKKTLAILKKCSCKHIVGYKSIRIDGKRCDYCQAKLNEFMGRAERIVKETRRQKGIKPTIGNIQKENMENNKK